MASFKDAFASARKAGKKVFTWEGKSYNTKLKEEVGAVGPKPRPKAEMRPKARPKAEPAKAPAPAPKKETMRDRIKAKRKSLGIGTVIK
jgi:hypothetical protein